MSNTNLSSGQDLDNPMGTKPIWTLLRTYAIPSIISLLVSSIYNFADQLFIANIVGIYGNAATNVAFPLTTLITAFSVLIGLGTAANFNLLIGGKRNDEAAHFTGNAVILAVILGIVVMAVSLIFLEPMLVLFGATENVLPFALNYTGITALGIPFLLFSTSMSYIIRADGSPRFSMILIASGAVLNIGLDALFMIVFGWGIAGAATATLISQVLSAVIAFSYLPRFKNVSITKETLRLRGDVIKQMVKLGISYFFFQFATMLSQIVLNNALTDYGAMSAYGSDIPLAVAAVVSKVSVIFMCILQGIGQSTQPIFGFNYGAKRYDRVRETYLKALAADFVVSIIAFIVFQVFPREIIGIFGDGSEEYFHFGEQYMRIFMMMIIISGVQPLTGQMFTAIGKAGKGLILSLSRQGYFLIPLLFILPRIFGINGVLYAAPIADVLAAILASIFAIIELHRMSKQTDAITLPVLSADNE